jgi:hypothetical protein
MAHTIKTFRGLLADGQQERIALQHIDGKTGYRIKKLEIMTGDNVGSIESASLVQVFTIKQTAISGAADFGDPTLLAAAEYRQHDNEGYGITGSTIIVDQTVFNQDIFVTNKDNNTGAKMNYYLELETFDLSDVEATATILKNFRNTNTVA